MKQPFVGVCELKVLYHENTFAVSDLSRVKRPPVPGGLLTRIYSIIMARTGQESLADFTVSAVSPASVITSTFPSSLKRKVLGAKATHTPQPIHFSWSTLMVINNKKIIKHHNIFLDRIAIILQWPVNFLC